MMFLGGMVFMDGMAAVLIDYETFTEYDTHLMSCLRCLPYTNLFPR